MDLKTAVMGVKCSDIYIQIMAILTLEEKNMPPGMG